MRGVVHHPIALVIEACRSLGRLRSRGDQKQTKENPNGQEFHSFLPIFFLYLMCCLDKQASRAQFNSSSASSRHRLANGITRVGGRTPSTRKIVTGTYLPGQ